MSSAILLPVMRTIQFIFAVEAFIAILVYILIEKSNESSVFDIQSLGQESDMRPFVNLSAAVTSIILLIVYLVYAFAKNTWQPLGATASRVLSIFTTLVLTVAWVATVVLMVPVALSAARKAEAAHHPEEKSAAAQMTEEEKLNAIVSQYASISAVALSSILCFLFAFSMVLLLVQTENAEVFDMDHDDSSELMTDWLDASSKEVARRSTLGRTTKTP